jgi:membrane-associated phospholipid phosphatase
MMNDMSWVPALRTPFLNQFFDLVTLAGYPLFLILFLAFGYFFFRSRSFFHAAILLIGAGLMNAFLKDYFQDSRPAAEFMLDPRTGGSYGWPSGHAQIAVVLWGFLAYEIGRNWAYISAFIIILLISASRIYLGVHDMGDVLGGLILGALCLAGYIWALTNNTTQQMAARLNGNGLLGVMLAAHAVYILVYPAHADHPAPVWFVGSMLGWLLARQWMNHAEAQMPGPLPVRLVVALLATAATFGLLLVTSRAAKHLALEGVAGDVANYGFGVIFSLALAWAIPRLIQKVAMR